MRTNNIRDHNVALKNSCTVSKQMMYQLCLVFVAKASCIASIHRRSLANDAIAMPSNARTDTVALGDITSTDFKAALGTS